MHRPPVLAVAASVVFMATVACSRSSSSSDSSRGEAVPGAEVTGPAAPKTAGATPTAAADAPSQPADDRPGPASAAPTAEERERAIQGVRDHCKGVTWSATLEVSPITGSASTKYQLRDGDQRWLAFVDDANASCRVVPVGRAVARWNGAYWDEEPDTKAFVLTQPGESDDEFEEWHDMVVVLRRQSGEILDAWETPCNGAYGAGLQAFDVFADRTSLMLSCYSDSGMARHQHLRLYHRVENGMELVWQGEGSWVDPDSSCAEDCPEACYAYKRYRFKVIRKDNAPPELETVYPTFVGTDHEEHMDHEEGAPKKPLNKQRWRYDPGKRAFVAVSRSSFEELPLETTCDVRTVMP